MTEFAKMDIFFFITSVAVVLLTVLLAVLVIYIIKISNDIKYISGKAKNEADFIAQDLSELRQNIKDKGAKMKFFYNFFSNLKNKKK